MSADNLTCEQHGEGEQVSGNVFLRHIRLARVGDRVEPHTHNFDHTTFVIAGRIHAVVDCPCGKRKEQDVAPGEHFLVKADWLHSFTALTPDVHAVCIYAHRTPQGEVVQDATGWYGAYE